MKIDKEVSQYLEGEMLSNGHPFRIERSEVVRRNDLLVRLADGLVVLHVGCADHVELIQAKRETGSYLHDLLSGSAARVVGSDINEDALERMRQMGTVDLYSAGEVPSDLSFDLVLVPDVIEHIPNVGDFLEGLRQYACDVVITTPNALRMHNRLLFTHELVNTDHRYWFSPYTLAKCLVTAGYDIKQMWYTDTLSRRSPVRSWLKRTYPACRDGLAIRATPRPEPG